MKNIIYIIIVIICGTSCTTDYSDNGQDLVLDEIDILLKGGHVIDPKNHIDSPMDVAILNGKILKVAKNISAVQAGQVINVDGMYITPGLINMHTHVYAGSNSGFTSGTSSQFPDVFSFRSGVLLLWMQELQGGEIFLILKKK